LTGCTTKQEPQIEYITKIEKIKITISEEYLNCPVLDVNTSKIKTQADIARLMIYVDESYNQCKSNMDYVKKELKNQ